VFQEVNLSALLDICPREAKPSGETKYNINPINNCMCVAIKSKSAIFYLCSKILLPTKPKTEFITTTTNNKSAK
jgi:hypothetical protein